MEISAHIDVGSLRRACMLLLLLSSLLVSACSSQPDKKLAVGDSAPLFALKSLDGKALNLADMKGSPVLLRFFLTDCKFCRADTPVFNEFYTKYNEQGLKVLYIDSLGVEQKTVKAFAKELGILFPVTQDRGGEVTRKYRVRALPQTIVLGPDHRIKAAILGGVSSEELDRLLAPYFADNG
jgi:peroxiredoxin